MVKSDIHAGEAGIHPGRQGIDPRAKVKGVPSDVAASKPIAIQIASVITSSA